MLGDQTIVCKLVLLNPRAQTALFGGRLRELPS